MKNSATTTVVNNVLTTSQKAVGKAFFEANAKASNSFNVLSSYVQMYLKTNAIINITAEEMAVLKSDLKVVGEQAKGDTILKNIVAFRSAKSVILKALENHTPIAGVGKTELEKSNKAKKPEGDKKPKAEKKSTVDMNELSVETLAIQLVKNLLASGISKGELGKESLALIVKAKKILNIA